MAIRSVGCARQVREVYSQILLICPNQTARSIFATTLSNNASHLPLGSFIHLKSCSRVLNSPNSYCVQDVIFPAVHLPVVSNSLWTVAARQNVWGPPQDQEIDRWCHFRYRSLLAVTFRLPPLGNDEELSITFNWLEIEGRQPLNCTKTVSIISIDNLICSLASPKIEKSREARKQKW